MTVRSETENTGDMELLNLSSLEMESDAILADTIHYHSRMLGRRTVRRQEHFLYQALVHATRDRLMERWIETNNKLQGRLGKRACYISLEFLMGRLLRNALLNLDITEQAGEALDKLGVDLEDIHQQEHDGDFYEDANYGGQGRSAAEPKEHDGGGDGDFKVIARPDHRRGGGVGVGELHEFRQAIPEAEDQHGLEKQRDGDPEDGQWIAQDRPPLEAEQQHERRQQGHDCDRRQHVQEFLLEPVSPLGLDDPFPRCVAGHQRQGDVDHDRQQQRLPGHGQRADTEEKSTQQTVE